MTGIIRSTGLILACGAIGQWTWPTLVQAQRALLEITPVTAPDGPRLMQVNDDGGLVVRAGENPGAIPASGSGYRLMWYPRKYAFRVGLADTEWDDPNIGSGSVAMGENTLASGIRSTAMGGETKATGSQSTAMGENTVASGSSSTALGFRTTASGASSVAMGRETQATAEGSTAMGRLTVAGAASATAMGELTKATGLRSTAMGYRTEATGHAATAMGQESKATGQQSVAMGTLTTASGNLATAMGYQTQAVGRFSTALGSNARALGEGSFVYGDASTTAILAAAANMFAVRASGGVRFRTSADESTGCNLQGGTGTWNCTSSRLAKEGFEDLDGESVLAKLAAMQIQRWRYRNTSDWHVGPTAEDFHAAFQLGPGPTTISTVDADGISLLAVQALERRTAELREENADLRYRLEALEAERAAERK
jgi:hypothetical protein